ncbi:metal ABC transporter substrate-binding protein [Leucobacter musarum]|uniref:metal ABC transporter substrate-binding protein n=1 Tax=Leucobacter musarum TaxID=1930747 RepID=UPI0006A77F7E|nr:metal ABC transporter substrate-binding protein [Leucobacter musarum]
MTSFSGRTFAHRIGLGTAALAIVALLLAGCSAGSRDTWSDDDWDGDPDAPVVLTTFTVLADMARTVGGDRINVRSITKTGAEIHGYEPTPLDVAKASEADLILDNGFGLEAWFSRFVAQADVPHVVVSDGIEPIDIAGDAYAGKPNPHAWMSPTNAQIYVENIVAAFSDLDPAHADEFAANGAAYRGQLQAVQDRLSDAVADLPEAQRALVTCEGAFSYLARDAGLTEQYIWPVNAEQQATPQQIAGTIEFVRTHDVPAVFCESTVSDRPMQQVVTSTDARFGGTLYVDSLSLPDGPVPTYLDLLTYDADTIAAALHGTKGSA